MSWLEHKQSAGFSMHGLSRLTGQTLTRFTVANSSGLSPEKSKFGVPQRTPFMRKPRWPWPNGIPVFLRQRHHQCKHQRWTRQRYHRCPSRQIQEAEAEQEALKLRGGRGNGSAARLGAVAATQSHRQALLRMSGANVRCMVHNHEYANVWFMFQGMCIQHATR